MRLRRRGSLQVLVGALGVAIVLFSGLGLRWSGTHYHRSLEIDHHVVAPSPPSIGILRLLTDRGYAEWLGDSGSGSAGERTGHPGGEDPELRFLQPDSPATEPETAGSDQWMLRNHPWGTDAVGRDLFLGSLISGTTYWVPGLLAALLALSLGTALGGVGAFTRSRALRTLLELLEDSLGSFPKFVVIMAVLSVFQITIWAIAISLGLLTAPRVARVVGEKIRALKNMDFVDSARELGLSEGRILWRHLLRANCRGVLVAQAVLALADLILVEATMGYLGFGLEGGVRSWGTLMAEGATQRFLSLGLLWPVLFPAALLVLTVLSLHLLARGVERWMPEGAEA